MLEDANTLGNEETSFCRHHRTSVNLFLHVLGGWIFVSTCTAILAILMHPHHPQGPKRPDRILVFLCLAYAIACMVYLDMTDMILFLFLACIVYETAVRIRRADVPIQVLMIIALFGYFLPYAGHVMTREPEILNMADTTVGEVMKNALLFWPQSVQCIAHACRVRTFSTGDPPPYRM